MESRGSRTVLRSITTLFSAGTSTALSDGELIERFGCRRDDAAEVAFAALVERHGPMVLRVCLDVLRDAHAAEDAFQTTFLILARKAGSIRKHGSVASWLFGVARRVATRAKVEHARRAVHERRGATPEDRAQETAPPVWIPEVQEEIDRLPERYRAPIVLCYFEGLTHEEAAGQLRVPIGTVKVRLMRARERLRGRLSRRGLAPAILAAALSGKALAAIPAPVVDSTIKAAVCIAAGRAAGVSAPVAALLEGVLKAMFLTKLKTSAAFLAAGLSLFLATPFVLAVIPRPARPDPPDAPPQSKKDETRKVVVETLRKSNFSRTSIQIGTVHAFETVDLTPRFSGYLKSLKVDIGDAVKRNQVVAEIDPGELATDLEKSQAVVEQARAKGARAQAQLDVAEAAMDVGKANVDAVVQSEERYESMLRSREKKYARYKELSENNSIPQEAVDGEAEHLDAARAALAEAKSRTITARADVSERRANLQVARAEIMAAGADLRVAEAGLRKAKLLLDSATVVSPLDGVVTRRGYHVGDFVRSGGEGSAPVATIIGTNKMRVVVEVPDRDAPFLDKGDRATVQLDAIRDRVYQGTITRTAYAEDPARRTLRAEIDLDNADGRLRPGQYGATTIVLEDLGDRLTIPLSALARDRGAGGDAACYRIDDGRAVRTRIKTGKDDGKRIEVIDGLKEGDSVVVRPGDDISDGQMIEPDRVERTKPN